MSVDLKLVLGTVNYTDYLRVSAAKVSDPVTEVFVDYINTPITNLAFVIPGLDPVNYYVRFRDAPTIGSLGTLVSEAFVNAQTGEFLYERRFYTIGALPGGASSTVNTLTDTYLVNKNVTGVFKEGFRYLEMGGVEATFNDATGQISLSTTDFSAPEKFIVEIKYNAGGTVAATASTPFTGTITVTAASYAISAVDKSKRFCLDCAGTVQAVTLPALSGLATGDFVILEHKRDGLQAQSKVLTAGTDKILWNGLNIGTNLLSELWVSKGQSLYLRKEGSNWEVIGDYQVRVGERMAAGFKDHCQWLPENGALLDGDEYPSQYWWIRNVLPGTHYITDDTVVSGGYAHPAGKVGQYVIHSTLKKFRLPNTQGMVEKGLKNFTAYGTDANRTTDYPGGWQDSRNKEYTDVVGSSEGTSLAPDAVDTVDTYAAGSFKFKRAKRNVGLDAWVQNVGFIYCRHI
jgi:hypothetical protein